MAKKKRKSSAKQKAAARRNIKKAQRARRGKTNKKRKTTSKSMARRKGGKKRGGSLLSGGLVNRIPILKNKTVQKIGFGLGMGSLAGLFASFIPVPAIQGNRDLIATGVAFATDPLAGVVRLATTGGLGQISSLFGGAGIGGQTNGSNGFA